MRIAFSLLSGIGYGGMTYFRNLLPAIVAVDQWNEYHCFVPADHPLVAELHAPNVVFHEVVPSRTSALGRFRYEQLVFPTELRRHRMDLLYTAKNLAVFRAPCPQVIAIRNMEPFMYRSFENAWALDVQSRMKWELTKRSIRLASGIVAVSSAVRDAVVERFPDAAAKIHVVYNGNPVRSTMSLRGAEGDEAIPSSAQQDRHAPLHSARDDHSFSGSSGLPVGAFTPESSPSPHRVGRGGARRGEMKPCRGAAPSHLSLPHPPSPLVGAEREGIVRESNEPQDSRKNPFLLTASKFVAYANQLNMIEAYARLLRTHPNAPPLWFAGGVHDQRYSDRVRARVAALGLVNRVRFLGLIPQEELHAHMRGATAFVFPSRLESCPHTLLEAMACGVPIATSNIPPMPEICGDAAAYFDPCNPVAMATAIARLLDDAALRDRFVTSGHERVKEFTWEKTARGLLEVFERVAVARSASMIHHS